jgi:signal transduction histidine kinase
LRGSLELALRTELSAQESCAALEQALELTDLVVQLITSLRELAEAAMADTPPQRLSLRDLVKEAVEELQGLADSRGVKAIIGTSLEAIVAAPPDRLREVISKLLWLVIRRSPDKGEMLLALSRQPAGGSAGFLIADQGPSLGPCQFALASGGTAGLGRLFAEAAKNGCLEWAAVKVLAESLGGTLRVMPRKPQGCSFLLQLPLADAD